MYRNLEAEIVRAGYTKKEVAEKLDYRLGTFYSKLNGDTKFTLDEALKIRNEFFPEMEIEYLFKKYEKTEA